jgi:tripartite-type tricarboxylate transporter receptor subunit TctC
MRRTAIGICAGLATLLAIPDGAYAQTYPAKTVRLVAAYPAGGSVDVVARLLGQKLGEALGQQFIVDNRAGASGNIGADYVAKAAPDGYTLLLSSTTNLASAVSLFKQLPFDPRRDFAPILHVTNQPHVLVLHPSVSARSVKEFVALARARPGILNSAAATPGSAQHVAAGLFSMATGITMTHVHYKGGAPAMTELVGGQVDLMFAVVPEVIQFVQSGKLRPLAVTTAQRSTMMADVPTMREAGLPNVEFQSWHGLAAPAGTAREIVARLNAESNKALASADLRNRLTGIGLQPAGGTTEEFQAFIQREIALYAKIVPALKIPLQ